MAECSRPRSTESRLPRQDERDALRGAAAAAARGGDASAGRLADSQALVAALQVGTFIETVRLLNCRMSRLNSIVWFCRSSESVRLIWFGSAKPPDRREPGGLPGVLPWRGTQCMRRRWLRRSRIVNHMAAQKPLTLGNCQALSTCLWNGHLQG